MLIVALLLLQLVTVVFAWLLNPTATKSQTAYALLLSVDFVSFAMVSYISRMSNSGEGLRAGYVLTGCGAALVLTLLILVV